MYRKIPILKSGTGVDIVFNTVEKTLPALFERG